MDPELIRSYMVMGDQLLPQLICGWLRAIRSDNFKYTTKIRMVDNVSVFAPLLGATDRPEWRRAALRAIGELSSRPLTVWNKDATRTNFAIRLHRILVTYQTGVWL